MKIELMTKDDDLIGPLEQRGDSFQIKRVSFPSTDADVWIVSDQVVHYNDLSERLLGLTNGHIFYLLHHQLAPNLFKHVKTICDTLGVYIVSGDAAPKQVVEKIFATLFPQETGTSKIAAFFAPVANIGTTSVALSTAMAISKSTRARVGVLGLNAWDDGTDQFAYKGESLDRLKNKLTGHFLGDTDEQVLSHFFRFKKDNVYYLAGNQSVKMERLFSVEDIQYLVNRCVDLFDVLILDAGSHFDNALMIQALRQADLKFLVLNQQRKAIKKFRQVYRDVLFPLGYGLSDFSLILNQYTDETGIPNDKDLISELNVPFLGKIPDVSSMGWLGENQQHLLYEYGDRVYVDSIDFIAKVVIKRVKLELNSQPVVPSAKSKWWRFSKLGAGV